MLPYPIEIAHDQPGCYLRLLPKLAELILSTMPSTRLLADNAIRAF